MNALGRGSRKRRCQPWICCKPPPIILGTSREHCIHRPGSFGCKQQKLALASLIKNLWKDVGVTLETTGRAGGPGSEGQELGQFWGPGSRNSWAISSGLVFWGDDPIILSSCVTHPKRRFPRREVRACPLHPPHAPSQRNMIVRSTQTATEWAWDPLGKIGVPGQKRGELRLAHPQQQKLTPANFCVAHLGILAALDVPGT